MYAGPVWSAADRKNTKTVLRNAHILNGLGRENASDSRERKSVRTARQTIGSYSKRLSGVRELHAVVNGTITKSRENVRSHACSELARRDVY